jgi:hypothetical protein
MSLSLTTFGFATAAIWIFRSTLHGSTPTHDAAIRAGASPGDAAH